MSSAATQQSVVPAQLALLAIYNPAFGDTDETAYEQIFYYYSRHDIESKHSRSSDKRNETPKHDVIKASQEDQRNERLRQVGLARGLVEFANNFSSSHSVGSIETEKSRIVLHQLEPGWWILASIDLTRLPSVAKTQKSTDVAVEYSSREVTPPALLITQLVRAHRQFLLHHAATLNDLHAKRGRPTFSTILGKYWDRFCRNWDVLLHGNPIVDAYNATKLAGGGEIGIGVGEEEWGSGEREVLEDFVHRTEGLTDLVVGRYGDPPPAVKKDAVWPSTSPAWLGKGDEPRVTDGIIFSGTGALSRRALSTLSQWMEAIFVDGEDAYGIGENPSSRPRQRRRPRESGRTGVLNRDSEGRASQHEETHPKIRPPRKKAPDLRRSAIENAATPPGIPPPLVNAVERSLADATKGLQQANEVGRPSQPSEDSNSYFDTDKMVSYLKLGYGSSWTLNPKGFSVGKPEKGNESQEAESGEAQPHEAEHADAPASPPQTLAEIDPTPEISDSEEAAEKTFVQRLEQSSGRFLIGLSGDLENTEFEADVMDETQGNEAASDAIRNAQRIFMRTIAVELDTRHHNHSRSSSPSRTSSWDTHDKLRVMVYVHQPFVFVFLFDLQTATLTIPSLYRSIHHQLGPLQKPLLRSTDPCRIPDRLADVLGDKANQLGAAGIYDLIYDPAKLTVRTSVPNIPLPGTLAAEGLVGITSSSTSTSPRTASGAWYTLGIPIGPSSPSSTVASTSSSKAEGPSPALVRSEYTRLDALNVHLQLLQTYIATRATQGGADEIERTVKTSRGWWVVWMRAPISARIDTRDATPSASAGASPGPVYFGTSHQRSRGSRPDVTGRGGEVEAFLVRKAVDSEAAKNGSGAAGSKGGSSGRWLLGGGGGSDTKRSVSGASAMNSGGVTSARGVVEGMGVDTRKWVEGLAKLSV